MIISWQQASYIGVQPEFFTFGPFGSLGVFQPSCSLSATPGSIALGGSSILSWTTADGPTSATIDNGVGSVNPSGGSLSVSPTATTIYHLTVTNSAGSGFCQTTVTVTVLAPVPVSPTPPSGACATHIDCTIELHKHPVDSDLYTFDWSGFIGTDVIMASNWAVAPGVTIVSASFTATTTSVTLGGGVAPNVYLLRNGIATTGGRALVRSARLFVNIATAVPTAPLQ